VCLLRVRVLWSSILFPTRRSSDLLATSNLPDEGGAALKGLGDTITNVNAATGGSGTTFSAEQLGYLDNIGKVVPLPPVAALTFRSAAHKSELQSREHLVCRLPPAK